MEEDTSKGDKVSEETPEYEIVELEEFIVTKFIVKNSLNDIVRKDTFWSLAKHYFNLPNDVKLKATLLESFGRCVFGKGKFHGVKSVGRKNKFVKGLKLIQGNVSESRQPENVSTASEEGEISLEASNDLYREATSDVEEEEVEKNFSDYHGDASSSCKSHSPNREVKEKSEPGEAVCMEWATQMNNLEKKIEYNTDHSSISSVEGLFNMDDSPILFSSTDASSNHSDEVDTHIEIGLEESQVEYPDEDVVIDFPVPEDLELNEVSDMDKSSEMPSEEEDKIKTCDDHSMVSDPEECQTRKKETSIKNQLHVVSPAFRKIQSEGTSFNHEVFFHNSNWKNINRLSERSYPSNALPIGAKLKDVMDDAFWGLPEKFQKDVCSTSNIKRNKVRGFLFLSFPPVEPCNEAAQEVGQGVRPGTPFPQFINNSSKMVFAIDCALCIPYQKWAMEKSIQRPILKSKTATEKLIQENKAQLSFEGMRQVYEHYISKPHQAAVTWFASSPRISDFFAKSHKKPSKVPCLHLWDPDIAIHFEKDVSIRRVQPKTLFQEKKKTKSSATACHDSSHKQCHTYKGWAKQHPENAKQLESKAQQISRSVYVPHDTIIELGGKKVIVQGGIKSLDPCCTGSASSQGNHPYTCESCFKQKQYLQNLIAKRSKASYAHLGDKRYGLVGFRHGYMRKNERDLALSKERIARMNAEKEIKSLRRVILSTRTWEEMLYSSCEANEEQKLVTNLMLLFERNVTQTNPLQITVLKNLVGKLKSKRNHKFIDIIKDISGMYKNKLGKLNYSLLEDIFGLPSSTTASLHIKSKGVIKPGLNFEVIDKAIEEYGDGPVIECSDEARTLRFLEPKLSSEGKVELLGCSWDPDVKKWPIKMHVPRKDTREGDRDDFSALERNIGNIVAKGSLAHSTNVHNFTALSSPRAPHLVHSLWPVPSKGFTASRLISLWSEQLRMARQKEDGSIRVKPLKLIGFSTDSAGYQLSAAASVMTPSAKNVKASIPCLGLDIPDERFLAPYFWEYPSIAYLDYLHERRLFLKNLKYTTRDLKLGEHGGNAAHATIEHLKELKKVCEDKEIECGLKESDLMLFHFMDQNQDACDAVFTLEIADFLDKFVVGSEGTSLYIRAVYYLTEPFHREEFGTPSQIQESISTGITILRLWRKALEVNKNLRINSCPGAASDPKKRGNFLTYGSYLTAEIQFAAATTHCLMMYLHFFKLGPKCCSPHLSGTKTTERIIAELQGKTTHIQCQDAQPTFGDIVDRISNVQFNQAAQKRVCQSGGKIANSSKRKLWNYTSKPKSSTDGNTTYKYPASYPEFLQQQRDSHMAGVSKAKQIFESYAPKEVVAKLVSKGKWDTPYTYPKPPGLKVVKRIDDLPCEHDCISHMCLTSVVSLEEDLEEEDALPDDTEMETEDHRDFNLDHSLDAQECSEEESKDRKWYITRELSSGTPTQIHPKRAISLLLPREYVSRERSRRHWVSKHLGKGPPPQDHDILQFRDIEYSTSSGNVVGRVVMIHNKNQGKSVTSAKASANDCIFRCRVYEELGDGRYRNPTVAKVTPWKAASSFICEVYLEKETDNGVLVMSTESKERLAKLAKLEKKEESISDESTSLDQDMYEVSDIIERRLVKSSQTYEYKVRFKGFGPEGDVWLPSAAFNQTVQFQTMSKYGRKRKHQTAQDDEIDPFSSHFMKCPPPPKKKRTSNAAKKSSPHINTSRTGSKGSGSKDINEYLIQSARGTRKNHTWLGRGVTNLGNTCWMSSVLQCIAQTSLSSAILDCQLKSNSSLLQKELRIILSKLKEKSNTAIDPKTFYKALGDIGSSLVMGQQNDALEFISVLSSYCKNNRLEVVHNYLQGDDICKWKCQECLKETIRVSRFAEVLIEVDSPGILLMDCLKSSFKDETLAGSNGRSCDSCNAKTATSLSTGILRNPKTLVIGIKRFNAIQQHNTAKLVKTTDPLCIQRPIDLSQLMSCAGATGKLKYHLCGAILHSGHSISKGHYIAVSPSSPSSNDGIIFDDSQVRLQANFMLSSTFQENCYVLFYERQTPSDEVPLLKRAPFSRHPCCNTHSAKQQIPIGLTKAQDHEVDVALCENDDNAIGTFSEYGLTTKDFRSLDGTNWLNDQIINAYLSLLVRKSTANVVKLESQFYSKLVKTGYDGVKTWNRKENILRKELVVIPLHLKDHWTLVVVDFKNKVLLYFDGMATGNAAGAAYACLNNIWVWLLYEAQERHTTLAVNDWKYCVPTASQEIPEQSNNSDCGVFLCMFARSILRNLAMDFEESHMELWRRQIAYELLSNDLIV